MTTDYPALVIRFDRELYEYIHQESIRYRIPMNEVVRLCVKQALPQGLDVPDDAYEAILDTLLEYPKYKSFTVRQIRAMTGDKFSLETVRHTLYRMKGDKKVIQPRNGQLSVIQ